MMIACIPRTRLLVAAAALLFYASAVIAADTERDALAQREQTLAAAMDRVAPCVVRIDTIGGAQRVAEVAGGDAARRTAAGFRQADGPTTGLIVSDDGYVLTSTFNFLRDPTITTVTLADGRRFVAELVARDHSTLLALLKIDAEDLPTPAWGSADEAPLGANTFVCGFGFNTAQPAISTGILSARSRIDGRACQTDAKLSPANYGGPLCDFAGRVLGVCVPLSPYGDEQAGVQWYDSGIGFAIRARLARGRAQRLRDGVDLERGLLGLRIDLRRAVVGGMPEGFTRQHARVSPMGPLPPPDSQPALPDPPTDGVRVLGVSPGGPAESAGVQEGDVIVRVAGAPVADLTAFRRVLARFVAGDEVKLTVARDDAELGLPVRLVAASDLAAPDNTEAQPVAPEDLPHPQAPDEGDGAP